MNLFEENDKNDYFENSEVPEKKEEKPRKQKLTPDDPRYWDQPEDEFDHLHFSKLSSWRLWIWVAVCAVIIGLIWAGFIRYFHSYISDATQYGYVDQMAKHGDMVNTYEGVLLPYKNVMDTTRVYDGDFVFSTTNDSVAAFLKKMQYANRPVRVEYKVYHTAVPWRGNSKIVVTRADSVAERDILPPDRVPESAR